MPESNSPESKSPEQIESEIVAQREQLADTVEALSAKFDVKSRAQGKVADVRDRATTDEGKPTTEVLAAAGSLVAMAAVLIIWRRRNKH